LFGLNTQGKYSDIAKKPLGPLAMRPLVFDHALVVHSAFRDAIEAMTATLICVTHI
jgi:hypothetical protein